MDVVEIERFSFLRQEIVRRLIWEASHQNRSVLSQSMIDSVVDHFAQLAPVANQCFRMLVI